ncbi:MAG: hypothetical protein VYA11_07180 [Planctomycetota bacterium]|nr:hypothetical protein [Planctomycetota bacterium]
MSAFVKLLLQVTTLISMGLSIALPGVVEGCSICASLSPTLCDEMAAADLAVVAEYIGTPEVGPGISDPEAYKSSFRIREILKGSDEIDDSLLVKVLFFPSENAKSGDHYLIHGNWIDNDDQTAMVIRWTTPIAMSDEAIAYLNRMWSLPEDEPQRLIEAMAYLENDDPMLRRDAFDEFGKAPYELLEQLKPVLDKHTLIAKINNPDTESNIRKLCYTLLTICGTPQELPFLASKIKQEQEQASESLPAIIACYLSIAGAEGLPLIENIFLMREGSDYERRAGDAITALRFHGQEASVIERERISDVFLRMLQRPTLGARVLSDLARWENWSAVDQVVAMFINAEGDGLWVREPAIRYLLACPTESAKKQIPKLEALDPLAVRNGRRFALPFAMGPRESGVDNQKATVSQVEPTETQQVGNSEPSADAPVVFGEKQPATTRAPIRQQMDRWRYGIPLVIGLLFVVLLGWFVMRRQPQSF